MVVYGEGRYRCDRTAWCGPDLGPSPTCATGRFEPRCPACGEALVAGDGARGRAARSPQRLRRDQAAHRAPRHAPSAARPEPRSLALRYHNVYGPRMPRDSPYAGVASIFRSALEAGRAPARCSRTAASCATSCTSPTSPGPTCSRSTADVVGALNIASGEPHTVGDMAAALADAVAAAELAPVVTGEFRLGDVRHVVASPERARAELGFTAAVPFADGIRAFATAPLRAPLS